MVGNIYISKPSIFMCVYLILLKTRIYIIYNIYIIYIIYKSIVNARSDALWYVPI